MIDNLSTKFYQILCVGRTLCKFHIGWNSPFLFIFLQAMITNMHENELVKLIRARKIGSTLVGLARLWYLSHIFDQDSELLKKSICTA